LSAVSEAKNHNDNEKQYQPGYLMTKENTQSPFTAIITLCHISVMNITAAHFPHTTS
jgi:hypothetical protein